jgi:hypothetical protein
MGAIGARHLTDTYTMKPLAVLAIAFASFTPSVIAAPTPAVLTNVCTIRYDFFGDNKPTIFECETMSFDRVDDTTGQYYFRSTTQGEVRVTVKSSSAKAAAIGCPTRTAYVTKIEFKPPSVDHFAMSMGLGREEGACNEFNDEGGGMASEGKGYDIEVATEDAYYPEGFDPKLHVRPLRPLRPR